ncbi:MAG: AAA family ATPase [Candidatus Omnitrophota bacterium]
MEKIKGFGFRDANDIEKREEEWVIEDLLQKGFGFIAGPPKGNSSPHGGKSLLSRVIGVKVINGGKVLGRYAAKRAKVLMINLDEMDYKVAEGLLNLSGGELGRGLLLSSAKSMRFPEDISRLEADVKQILDMDPKEMPLIVFIDPLLRIVGGRDINSNSATGPVIDGLKRIQRENDITMVIIHHCVKNEGRNKENSATWLSGSADLDAAWDFLLGLEFNKKKDAVHIRCFYKYQDRQDIFYRSIKSGKAIVGIELLDGDKGDVGIESIRASLDSGDKTVKELVANTKMSKEKVKRILLANTTIFEKKGKNGKAAVWGIKDSTVQDVVEQLNDGSVHLFEMESEQK